jgi:hypothetical protein
MLDVTDLRDTLVKLKLTGELNRNVPESNRQAIREMLARNDYWAMGAEGLQEMNLTYEEAASIVASNLGLTDARFASSEPCYIDPEHTISRLITGYHRLEAVAHDHGRILFTTAHPGSMLSFYRILADHFTELGAEVVRLEQPVPAPDRRWLDDLGGVIVLSDEGNLMHTHSGNGMKEFIKSHKPDIILADHAFAVAAINSDRPTVAIFDVDDPAIPILAHANPDTVVAVPMNDNQTNARTAQAATALIETITHARSLRHPAVARTAGTT